MTVEAAVSVLCWCLSPWSNESNDKTENFLQLGGRLIGGSRTMESRSSEQ